MARKKTTWSELNQENLKSILLYDADTGVFRWKVYRSRIAKAGMVAGAPTDEGYIAIKINFRLHKAHRLAWLYEYGELPSDQIDHINGDRSDNRISNLRAATHAENAWNAKLRKDSSSGFKGVSYLKAKNRWRARINDGRRTILLGTFRTPEDASRAYVEASRRIHGEFSNPGQSAAADI